MDNITANITTTISANMADSGVPAIGQITESVNKLYNTQYSYGKGQRKINEPLILEGTANAAPVTIDLYGDERNIFNQQARFTSIKEIIIINTETASGKVLTVGNAGSTPNSLGMGSGSHTMKIGPGGKRHISEPIDGILAGSSLNNFKLDPGANSIAYQIWIFGENANL